ncbi:MAG: GFA family protein [Rhodospirillales bacterium]|jgi:hypothetical protein|nr:GFA family protein [Rhodospirillales bacterium]
MTHPFVPLEGACTCGRIGYRLEAPPLVVHCCHCTWCQRETGSAFALNAMIETSRVTRLAGEPELVPTPSASGRGQRVFRCPTCRVALWSTYPGAGPAILFVRVGTLRAPHLLAPDIHIFTATKLPWVTIPDGARAVAEYYNPKDVWPADSLARFRAARAAAAS